VVALLQIIVSIILVVSYFIYLRQTMKDESTPNPGSWIIWFVIMGFNTLTYFKVTEGDYFKTAIAFAGFVSVTVIMSYALWRGKFAKITTFDVIILLLAIILGVFWRSTSDDKLTNLLLQFIMLLSFLPTVIGLLQNRLREKYLPWTVATIAYVIKTISVPLAQKYSSWELFFPIINGIIGNGIIVAIIFHKRKKGTE